MFHSDMVSGLMPGFEGAFMNLQVLSDNGILSVVEVSAQQPLVSSFPAGSDSDFEVAEGKTSAQTDLEELVTNNNDDDHKETSGAEGDPLVSLASSLTVDCRGSR